MVWKDLMVAAYRERQGATPSFPRFKGAAAEAHLVYAEQALGAAFPGDLRGLLAECDGVIEVIDVDGELIETGWIVWPVEMILKEHSDPERATIGPPGTWLVFGNAGADGVLFGYDGDRMAAHIWGWHPIEARSQLLATSLAGFLRGWITGGVGV